MAKDCCSREADPVEAWIDESYRAVAPKRLLNELDAVRQAQRSPDEQLPELE